MQVSRSHGVGSRAGGLLAVALAILGLGFLVFSSSRVSSTSSEETNVGQAALRAYLDPETGELTVGAAPVAAEADAELESMLSRSTEGLHEVVHPHGGVGVHLRGRFQSAAVARIDADGELRTSCSEHPGHLEAFRHGHQDRPPKLEVK